MRQSFARVLAVAIVAVAMMSALHAQAVVQRPAPKFKTGIVGSGSPLKQTASRPAPKKKPAPKKPASPQKKLPRLLDLGATKCIPCKMMVPVLESLKKEYKGKLTVEFIDITENQPAGQKFKIRTIPTQIFFDAGGKEIDRHIGYISKEDIIAKFKQHGIKLTK